MITMKGAHVYNAGSIERIPPGEGRNIRVGGEEIAVFRTRAGELYALQSTCPHKGGPLADGVIGGGRVVCPLHNFAFDLSSGAALREGCASLRTYRVSVSSAGDILLTLPGSEGGNHG